MTDLRKAAEMALEALEKDPVPLNAINNAQYFLRQALAQPEQEPVAWITPDFEGFRMRLEPPVDDVPLGWTALYTAPPKQWVGLHLDDIPETFVGDWSFLEGAKWAEAKLKEKNGA